MKGVLDRIEDGLAVILVEEKGDEFTISAHELPVGSKEGTWFELAYEDGGYFIHSIDEQATKKHDEASNFLLTKLQQKKKRSKFKRS